jgi:serine/threonine protein phosphatase 1
MHGPEREFHSSNFSWDRTLWELAIASHGHASFTEEGYADRLKLFGEIYIGHTPVTRWGVEVPWQRANVWNVDTGAAFKGKLSVMDIDSKEVWQSDPVWTLYPEEKGRN